MQQREIVNLHKKYAPNETEFNLVFEHCSIVSEIALWCAKNTRQKVDIGLLQAASLLHDIGSYPFLAAEKASDDHRKCYPQHAILGAKILADEGVSENIWKLVETHVLLGLTKVEILEGSWLLPLRDYEPSTIEGRLLCYADRFHSKQPTFNSFESFKAKLDKTMPKQAAKFVDWAEEFGIPDIETLSRKYGHPIR